MKPSTKDIKTAQLMIKAAAKVCVLTGAGVSAESGMKTFRDSGGLWENHAVEKVATPEGFADNPELVWRFYNARRRDADVAVPNPGHLALARLELAKRRQAKRSSLNPNPSSTGNGNGNGKAPPASAEAMPFTLLTQNIDGLHQQAGSTNVVELHGSIWKVRCSDCEALSVDHPIELPLLPHCESCGGLLRPDVVWFGENLDPDILARAEAAAEACDLFLVVGTSALVQPAASFPFLASKRSVPILEVNMESTPVTSIARLSMFGKAGELLPKLLAV